MRCAPLFLLGASALLLMSCGTGRSEPPDSRAAGDGSAARNDDFRQSDQIRDGAASASGEHRPHSHDDAGAGHPPPDHGGDGDSPHSAHAETSHDAAGHLAAEHSTDPRHHQSHAAPHSADATGDSTDQRNHDPHASPDSADSTEPAERNTPHVRDWDWNADRRQAEENGWIWTGDDLTAGFEQARQTGKPLMIVVRCPP